MFQKIKVFSHYDPIGMQLSTTTHNKSSKMCGHWLTFDLSLKKVVLP